MPHKNSRRAGTHTAIHSKQSTMATLSEHNVSSLLELIPSSQLEPQQIAVTKEGVELPTYKFLRAPRTLDELEPYSKAAIWMENGTLVFNYRYFAPWHTTTFKKRLELSSCVTFEIYGDSDDAIVETAVFFGSLRNPEASASKKLTIRFNDEVNFDAARSEKLATLFEPASTMKLKFFVSKVNKFLSTVLATRPFPLNLIFETTSIDFDAFMEHLEARTTSFGSLSIGLTQHLQRRLFDHLHLFENLYIISPPRDLLLKLLAAPM